jgi:N-acetyl-gamma-glutamyl-phosphate reductase
LVLISCLDNLLKGAASQAVQNMNLMAGWHEAEGLL